MGFSGGTELPLQCSVIFYRSVVKMAADRSAVWRFRLTVGGFSVIGQRPNSGNFRVRFPDRLDTRVYKGDRLKDAPAL